MYSLKGFITVNIFADNAVGAVSPLGELSTRSQTFSREVGHYSHTNAPMVDLVSFSSKRLNEGLVPVNSEYAQLTLEIGQYVVEEAIAGTTTDDKAAFLQAITSEFSGIAEDFNCGDMVATNDSKWLPEYLLFSAVGVLDPGGVDDEENYIKIWFSDDSFQSQYDEYEIVVIPPVDTVDSLYQDAATVGPLLDARTMDELMLDIEEATNGDPYTFLRTKTFEWQDPNDSSITLPTNWTIAIYGEAGDNIDNIKEALSDYVLDNSIHDREDWLLVLPDLFRVTEFIIAPLWDQYSIPNQTLQAGIYKPTGRVKDMVYFARDACVGYPDSHVDNVVEYTVFMYKSLGMLIVGGPENRDGINVFTDQFTDYIMVSTASADFNRMSPNTQNWVMLMYDMINEAEDADEFSDLPIGMSRVIRDGKLYITSMFDNVNYLVVAKSNYNS